MNAKTTRKISNAPLAFARKLDKTFGPCTVIRSLTQRFPKLPRGDVLEIADSIGINRNTANRQFQEIRSGNLQVVG